MMNFVSKIKMALFLGLFIILSFPIVAQAGYFYVEQTGDDVIIANNGYSQYMIEYNYECYSSDFLDGDTIYIDANYTPLYGDTIVTSGYFEKTCEVTDAEEVNLKKYYVEKVLDNDDKIIVNDKFGDSYLVEYGIGCGLGMWRYENKNIDIDIGGSFLDGIGDRIYLIDRGDDCKVWDVEELSGNYSGNSPSYGSPVDTATLEALLQNSCPANSHTSATDATMCQCDVGYQPNSTKDGCSLAPIKSNTQVCQESFGVNVDWDGTKAANGDLNCNCKVGYIWNSGRSECVLPPAIPTPTLPKILTPTSSQIETKPVIPTPLAKKEFLIDDAKINNYNVELFGETNTSATLRKCPSTSDCDALRYYVEGVQVKILGDYNNGEWYNIIAVDTKQEGWMHSSIISKVELQEAEPHTDELKEIHVSEKTQKDVPWYKKVFSLFSNLFK